MSELLKKATENNIFLFKIGFQPFFDRSELIDPTPPATNRFPFSCTKVRMQLYNKNLFLNYAQTAKKNTM